MRKHFNSDYIIRLWLCSAFFVLSGGFVLYINQFNTNTVIKSMLDSVSSVLIISGVYNVISDYILKNKLIELIMDKVKLSNAISATGLLDIILNINSINYTEFFSSAKSNIDIVHVYGKTWTNNHLEAIKLQLIRQKSIDLHVLLMAPNSSVTSSLCETYGGTSDDIKNSMKTVANMWIEMFGEVRNACPAYKCALELRYHYGQPCYSLYRVDDRIICVQNKLAKGRSQKLPSLICRKSENSEGLYEIYQKEIADLLENSAVITSKNLESYFVES